MGSFTSTPLLSTSLYFQPAISPTLFSSSCIFLRSKASLVAGTNTGADNLRGFLLFLVVKVPLGSPGPGPPLGETIAPLSRPVPGPPLGGTRPLSVLFCIGCQPQ